MAALVQTIPQQTTTMMSGPPSPGYAPQHQSSRNAQKARYHNPSASANFRGPSGLVAPYAFTSTPQLANPGSPSRPYPIPHLRSENRSVSAPSLPLAPAVSLTSINLPSVTASGSNAQRKEEDNPLSLGSFPDFSNWEPNLTLPPSGSAMTLSSTHAPKPSPDRYRRNVRRVDTGESGPNRVHASSNLPSGSGMAAVGHLYTHPTQSNSSPSLNSYQSYRGSTYSTTNQPRNTSVDDMNLGRANNAELAKRYRRRSLGSLETAGLNHENDMQNTPSPHPNAFVGPSTHRVPPREMQSLGQVQRPTSSHQHNGSSESSASARSVRSQRPGSTQNESPRSASPARSNPSQTTSVLKQEAKIINVPQRIPDPSKRNPSPLSRPVNIHEPSVPDTPLSKNVAGAASHTASSPAADHLAAVSQKDTKKPKSKLRRAFSFGSATELRRATAQHNLEKSAAANVTSKRTSKYEDELEPEQAKIAEKQEAGGIGESIYSGQGHFFTGSTDNLSISSTASSASIMLRKMGKGVKKSTRSLVGLFRPKSVIGVPAADGPVNQASAAQVTMVTVEAEREKVNVNINAHDQPGGGTGFPRLERNSIDAKLSTDSGTASTDTRSRRSIVGGEWERAEVLAAVKKGILKRNDSGQSSPIIRPHDFKAPDFNLPQIPHINDSPRSSAPSTPADDHPPRSGHRRTDSITIEGTDPDDYFSSVTRFTSGDSRNAPLTPRAVISRNISFSPRIQFHDTWPSGEYDRRGEVATCNRLTPMLAQQIKEELNTFKMEMEVHESSKVYTHFF